MANINASYPRQLGRLQSLITPGLGGPGTINGIIIVVTAETTHEGAPGVEEAPLNIEYASGVVLEGNANRVLTVLHALASCIRDVRGDDLSRPVEIWAVPVAAFYAVAEEDWTNMFELLQAGAVKATGFRACVPLLGYIPRHLDWVVVELERDMVLPPNQPGILTEQAAKNLFLYLNSPTRRHRLVEVGMEGCGFKYTMGHSEVA
jgi:hypothetical protein